MCLAASPLLRFSLSHLGRVVRHNFNATSSATSTATTRTALRSCLHHSLAQIQEQFLDASIEFCGSVEMYGTD
eukprot:m.23082 g.23082  ORF g.23082 m.23082 type:complete len:73 (-) comp12904_c0_seq1:621-839(-)